MNDKFNGPLFIIGYPRSGTKLLRDLLNQNPNIGIPTIETNFIPKMINKYGNPPNFDKDETFDNFYKEIRKTVFWRLVNKDKIEISKKYILDRSNRNSWSSIFETIFRYYAPENRNQGFIWGDKTPVYLDKILFIKKIFPKAKFIHIIRDPRDCCLSERKTWGKNIFRTAELWRKRIMKARDDSKSIENDYTEIFYEDLISRTELVIKELCGFISREYDVKMIRLKKPSENLGDTKGETTIISHNKGKYIYELNNNEIKRIEEITYPLIKKLNYTFVNDVSFKPLNRYSLFILKIFDVISMTKFNVSDKGFFNGIKHYYQLVKDI